MHKFPMTLASVAIASVISACSNSIYTPTEQQSKANTAAVQIDPMVAKVLATDVDQLWSQDFNHYQAGMLKSVAEAISFEALQGELSNDKLEKLTFYLRIYSSFGNDKYWSEQTAEAVNNALTNLYKMQGFFEVNPTTARLHENYAVALYRLYFLAPLQPFTAEQVKPLSQLINLYASANLTNASLTNDKAIDYALWEVLRAGAIFPYEARRKNDSVFTQAVLGQDELQQALTQFITAKNNTLADNDWPRQHALWALAQYYNLYNKEYWNEYYQRSADDQKRLDDDKLTLEVEDEMGDLDNSVWAALTEDKQAPLQQSKTLFSVPYVVNTFRGSLSVKREL